MAVPAFNDNYIWLIIHASTRQCLIVDPGEADSVLAALQQHQLEPTAILLTHHHFDHVGGVEKLLTYYPMRVFGPAAENISTVTEPLSGGEVLSELGEKLSVIAIPGHTRAHIAYYFKGSVFCGDTLFTAGCGRIFEGTAPQMFASLMRLANLPDNTYIYCGHEYTTANLQFAITVEPDNPAILARIESSKQLRRQNLPTVPAPLNLEKQTNPFLRATEPAVIEAASAYAGTALQDPIDVFRTLRMWKDSFVPPKNDDCST
jgi:hydroxyacylglutathione hydrolase